MPFIICACLELHLPEEFTILGLTGSHVVGGDHHIKFFCVLEGMSVVSAFHLTSVITLCDEIWTKLIEFTKPIV